MADSKTTAMLEIFGEALHAPDDAQREMIVEAFDKIRSLIDREDQGWIPLYSGGLTDTESEFGLKLDDLKSWGRKIRESIVGAPWIGAGFRRRQNYIWRGGIRYGSIPSGGVQGKKNIQAIIDSPGNQFHFFGKAARRAREECLYAEGVAFWIGNEKTKQLTAIPLRQITDQITEPNGLGYAIAYKREWTERNLRTGDSEKKTRWYFTDRFVDQRVPTITTKLSGKTEVEEVDQKHVIFDQIANGSTGLVYGAPDAVAAWVWNGIARDATMDGVTMTQAMATFAFKASVKSPGGAQNAAIELASPQGAGQTAIAGQANDLVPMSSAGKGYDFSTLTFLVAVIAASLDVSVIDLTSDPGNAGSSYNAGELMTLPTRLAMEARRDEHVELDKRVLTWMGVDSPEVTFVPFNSGEEMYRSVQSMVLELDKDSMTRQEFRDRLDDLFGRPNGTVPAEDQRPSVLLAKALAKATPKPAATPADGAQPGETTSTPQTASPNQGRSNGTGGQQGGSASNDIRRD